MRARKRKEKQRQIKKHCALEYYFTPLSQQLETWKGDENEEKKKRNENTREKKKKRKQQIQHKKNIVISWYTSGFAEKQHGVKVSTWNTKQPKHSTATTSRAYLSAHGIPEKKKKNFFFPLRVGIQWNCNITSAGITNYLIKSIEGKILLQEPYIVFSRYNWTGNVNCKVLHKIQRRKFLCLATRQLQNLFIINVSTATRVSVIQFAKHLP